MTLSRAHYFSLFFKMLRKLNSVQQLALCWLEFGVTGFLTSLLPTLFTAPDVTWTLSVPDPSVVLLLANIRLSCQTFLLLKAQSHALAT